MGHKSKKINKRSYFKSSQKRKSKRIYGGSLENLSKNGEINRDINEKAADNIMNKIEEQNKIKLPNFEEIPVVGPVIEKTADLVEGAAVKSLDAIGDSIGVDIDNPQSISDKLDNIKEAVMNPENIEKTKEILGNAGKYIEVGIEAAGPVLEKTADKILPVVTKEADKAIQAGVGTVVNLAEDVAGPFIGIPRTLLSAAEAFNASVNAGSELVKGTAEAIQGTQENFNRIMNEKISQIPNMPTNIPKMPTNIPKMPTNMPTMPTMPTNIPTMPTNIPTNIQNMSRNIQNMKTSIPKIPEASDSMSRIQKAGGSLKKYQKEAKMIGGRVIQSQLEFLYPHVKGSQILQQYGGNRQTKRRHYLKRKLTSRRR